MKQLNTFCIGAGYKVNIKIRCILYANCKWPKREEAIPFAKANQSITTNKKYDKIN